MYQSYRRNRGMGLLALLTSAAAGLLAAGPAHAEIDRSLYMPPDEIRPGMKGFGRTVMSGTAIQTFDVEVISVMHNAFYAKQDVILVRCSGLKLDHTGIIGGMSGSPCYVRDDQGRERMIGAVAYGWTFSKDPICGVQPITQMLEVAEVRKPKPATQPTSTATSTAASNRSEKRSGAMDLSEWVARAVGEPIDGASRLGILNGPPVPGDQQRREEPAALAAGLRPLEIPVMVSSLCPESMAFLRPWFHRFGLTPVASGGAAKPDQIDPNSVKLEPGSTLCVTLMTGDMVMDGLGTCTTVMGDRVLGFGHEMFGEGSIELPLATGFVHTVIPSIARSDKLGASLKVVGTLWGDESTAVFGTVGRTPTMVPMTVEVNDLRGKQSYHYEIAQEDRITASLLTTGLMESAYAHNGMPREHTVRYSVEADFGPLGIYRAADVTSGHGVSDAAMDLMIPVMTLMNAPLARRAKVVRAKATVEIENVAHSATMHEVMLPKTVYKPGETVTATVRWAHYRHEPMFTYGSYPLALPEDLPDGSYELTLCSASGHLAALRTEKPYLFRAETLAEALDSFNLMGKFSGNRLYMRLGLKGSGLAYKREAMPDLPASRRRILADAKLTGDLTPCSEALVIQHDTDFVVNGKQVLSIQVKRYPDQ
jgi:hypothetical protein